ncbi:MAG: hypothetical protein ABJC39_06385 [Chloroflexota bacterium]
MEYRPTTRLRLSVLPLLGVLLAACGTAATPSVPSATSPAAPTTAPSTSAPTAPSSAPTPSLAIEQPTEGPSQAPDTGGGTTAGDVPDNAVFLTYTNAAHGFSIQYVEGWQVTTGPDGVIIRDKDSSETVAVVGPASDVGSYISGTDLPALQAQTGFKLVKQDRVKFKSGTYDHVVFHLPSPPDPVTGKQIPSTVDRFYVPGTTGLAIVSLSTPDGVDNVDAFRTMIESFKWS